MLDMRRLWTTETPISIYEQRNHYLALTRTPHYDNIKLARIGVARFISKCVSHFCRSYFKIHSRVMSSGDGRCCAWVTSCCGFCPGCHCIDATIWSCYYYIGNRAVFYIWYIAISFKLEINHDVKKQMIQLRH